MRTQQIPVLTYHAGNITGNSYQTNDRIAFQSDLYTLHQMGFKIIPLQRLVDWLLGIQDLPSEDTPYIALSCDDGIDQDYLDGEYLQFGPQKSLYNLLNDFQQEVGTDQQPQAHLTAFVIADYSSRQIIAEKSLKGQPLFNDDWWQEANNSALMSIENHSWDHRHPYIYPAEQAMFSNIETKDEADLQIIQAKRVIDHLSGGNSRLFCYPWGQTNDFLVKKFLPDYG